MSRIISNNVPYSYFPFPIILFKTRLLMYYGERESEVFVIFYYKILVKITLEEEGGSLSELRNC